MRNRPRLEVLIVIVIFGYPDHQEKYHYRLNPGCDTSSARLLLSAKPGNTDLPRHIQ
jgi:hypothetical protein